MTNYLKNVVIAGSRKYYRHSPLFYWYFDSKAKTQDFNASVCIGLLLWRKCGLKSILRGCTCCFIPPNIQNSKYPLYIIVLMILKALFY